jgi:hypothetical protein
MSRSRIIQSAFLLGLVIHDSRPAFWNAVSIVDRIYERGSTDPRAFVIPNPDRMARRGGIQTDLPPSGRPYGRTGAG